MAVDLFASSDSGPGTAGERRGGDRDGSCLNLKDEIQL